MPHVALVFGVAVVMAWLMGLSSVSPAEVHALVTRRAATVVDVNAPSRWLDARVPGAVNLDHLRFEASDLPSAKDARLVFYCSNPLCRKAPLAARRAKRMGYANVAVMSAGISGWIEARLPVASGAA